MRSHSFGSASWILSRRRVRSRLSVVPLAAPKLRTVLPGPAQLPRLVLLSLVFAVSACRSDSSNQDELIRRPYFDCDDACRPLYLYVSNQSFEDPEVHIQVLVDGKQALADTFDVKDQHHWVLFPMNFEKGSRTLEARARGHSADTTFQFELGDPPLWAVLDFWSDEGEAHFTFRESEQRPGFE